MSFTVTMIWMIGTAIAVLLLLGIGFPAMAGALSRPKWLRRHHAPATERRAHHHRFHLRHGH